MPQAHPGKSDRWEETPAVVVAPPLETDLSREVVEQFPYGILVTDADGSAIRWNREAGRLLRLRFVREGAATTCCELFGCRTEGTPLEGVCITELALEADDSLPELRLDLPLGAAAGAVWLTAAAIGDRVVLNLRPGERGDRRRRTQPHWIAGPLLRVHTFGETRIESAEGPIDGAWLRRRSGQLFKLLLVERHRVMHAEEVAQALWPDGGRSALSNVRHFVHSARHHLEPDLRPRAPSSFIVARQGGYALDLARVRVDTDEFEAEIEAGRRAYEQGKLDLATQRTAHALELYRGDFLADEPYAEWVLAERDRLRALASAGCRLLADIRLGARDLEGAAVHLERLSDLDPFDLDVQRQLITLWLSSGRRSEGLRRFATLRQRLMNAFGEVPDFQLADLADDAAAWRLRSTADVAGDGPPARTSGS